MTRLALVNAIYFKGNWKNRFDEANTKEMPFKVNQVSHLQFLSQGVSVVNMSDLIETQRNEGRSFIIRTFIYVLIYFKNIVFLVNTALFSCNNDSLPVYFPPRCTH